MTPNISGFFTAFLVAFGATSIFFIYTNGIKNAGHYIRTIIQTISTWFCDLLNPDRDNYPKGTVGYWLSQLPEDERRLAFKNVIKDRLYMHAANIEQALLKSFKWYPNYKDRESLFNLYKKYESN